MICDDSYPWLDTRAEVPKSVPLHYGALDAIDFDIRLFKRQKRRSRSGKFGRVQSYLSIRSHFTPRLFPRTYNQAFLEKEMSFVRVCEVNDDWAARIQDCVINHGDTLLNYHADQLRSVTHPLSMNYIYTLSLLFSFIHNLLLYLSFSLSLSSSFSLPPAMPFTILSFTKYFSLLPWQVRERVRHHRTTNKHTQQNNISLGKWSFVT